MEHSQIPANFTKGDTFLVKIPKNTYSQYKDFSLLLVFINSKNKITITSEDTSEVWLLKADKIQTKDWQAGFYTYQLYAFNDNERHTIDTGEIRILEDYETAEKLDDRSYIKKLLDAVNDILSGRAKKEYANYTIGNKALTLLPPSELIKLKKYLESELYKEELSKKAEKGIGRHIKFR